MKLRMKWMFSAALLALAMTASGVLALDVVNYKSLAGVVWHQQDLYVTINSFTDQWKNVVGKNWYMTMTVQNRGDDPATFDASKIEIDDSKGTSFRAQPVTGAPQSELKQTLSPGGSAQFKVMFDGHIYFDRRTPAHLKYTLDTKVDIIK
ncbi:MAG: DUF4352 domain-containing protein [Acidobacteriia bacterium]|nr:DUF4352 domain-containing protein [Terriglobia bacterium]